MTTFAEFAEDNGLTMKVRYDGTHIDDQRWEARHYRVKLKSINGETFKFKFRMGMLLAGPPQVDDVLESLAIDARCYVDSADVDDFAADLGIVTPSRAIEAYKECRREYRALGRLFGENGREALLYNVEVG